MKWYTERLEEISHLEPIYSVCGDDCAVCPRFLARTEEELHETAAFWHDAGWRDHVVTNEEIRCAGCGSRGKCTFMMLPCLREHQAEACVDCAEYPCTKIDDMLKRSAEKQAQCRSACENDMEYAMLCRAFYDKERNLKEKPCRINPNACCF